MDLHQKIRTLPTSPGVYLYKNADGEIIYVGKANNLRSRVRSYFLEGASENAKTGTLLREAVDLDYIVVDNEKEALALENNLIKQKKPRYNILLRDDKTYPYIKLTIGERYPRVFPTRRLRKDGSLYYGPFFPTSLAYRIVDLIHRHFLIPSCKLDLNRYYPRPCLQYYIGRCLGPCVEGLTTPERYAEAVHDVKMFLEGRGVDLSRSLQQRMIAAAEREQFELAAKYRDLISTVSLLEQKQRIAAIEGDDADVFGYHYENEMLAVNLFHMRGGKIVDKREFFWEDLGETVAGARFEPGEFFSALLKQVYLDQQYVPHTIYVPVDFEDRNTLEEVLSEGHKRRVQIHVPQRGDKRSLVDLVGQNAKQAYDQRFRVMKPAAKAIQEALQDALMLPAVAQAHRVLRHLAHPGCGNRRLHGGVGKRRDEKVRLPQVHYPRHHRSGRLRFHARSGHAPLQACAGFGGRGERRFCARWGERRAAEDAEPGAHRRRHRTTAFRSPGVGVAGHHQPAAGRHRQARRNHLRPRPGGRAHRARPPLAGAAPGAAGARRGPSLRRHLPSQAPPDARSQNRTARHSRHRRSAPRDDCCNTSAVCRR